MTPLKKETLKSQVAVLKKTGAEYVKKKTENP